MPADLDYKYDVFISYKHRNLLIPWVSLVKDTLEELLGEALGGRDARIFFDTVNVVTGEFWQDSLRQALSTFACMVAIWTPSYFVSEWCLTEWRTFQERTQMVNMGPETLIFPIVHNDGEWFPDDATQIQMHDFSDCTTPVMNIDAFRGTRRAQLLGDKLEEFVKPLANVILNAPQYQADWPVVKPGPIQPLSRTPNWRL